MICQDFRLYLNTQMSSSKISHTEHIEIRIDGVLLHVMYLVKYDHIKHQILSNSKIWRHFFTWLLSQSADHNFLVNYFIICLNQLNVQTETLITQTVIITEPCSGSVINVFCQLNEGRLRKYSLLNSFIEESFQPFSSGTGKDFDKFSDAQTMSWL